MRPMIAHPQLQTGDVEKHPALALLGPVDSVLEALVLALRARHARLDRFPLPADHWDLELRRAQNIAALARALQIALVDYHADQLDRVRRAAHDHEDIPF